MKHLTLVVAVLVVISGLWQSSFGQPIPRYKNVDLSNIDFSETSFLRQWNCRDTTVAGSPTDSIDLWFNAKNGTLGIHWLGIGFQINTVDTITLQYRPLLRSFVATGNVVSTTVDTAKAWYSTSSWGIVSQLQSKQTLTYNDSLATGVGGTAIVDLKLIGANTLGDSVNFATHPIPALERSGAWFMCPLFLSYPCQGIRLYITHQDTIRPQFRLEGM